MCGAVHVILKMNRKKNKKEKKNKGVGVIKKWQWKNVGCLSVVTPSLTCLTLSCDPHLKNFSWNTAIFLHDTLVHDDALPHLVWLQKVQQLRRYHPDEQSLEFSTFPVNLTLTTTQQSIKSNLFTRKSSLQWCAIKPSLVAKGSAVQKYQSYFDYLILHCVLNLGDSKLIFLKDNLAHNDASQYKVW